MRLSIVALIFLIASANYISKGQANDTETAAADPSIPPKLLPYVRKIQEMLAKENKVISDEKALEIIYARLANTNNAAAPPPPQQLAATIDESKTVKIEHQQVQKTAVTNAGKSSGNQQSSIPQIDTAVKAMNTKLKSPSFTLKETKSVVASFDKILESINANGKYIPLGIMYELYDANLFVLANSNKMTEGGEGKEKKKKTTLELQRLPHVLSTFKHFGTIHKLTKITIHAIVDAEDEFNDFVISSVQKIRDTMQDPKQKHDIKKKNVSEQYAILFNRVRAFLYTNNLNPEASIDYVMLDDDLIQTDPPILTPETLQQRFSEDVIKKMGKILNNLHKNHKGERVKRFFTLLNKHFDELHQAYELFKKCGSKQAKPADSAKLVRYSLMALRKANTLMHHVEGFKLYADNQIRLSEFRKSNCAALDNNKEVQAELTKLGKFIDGFDETQEKNVMLLKELKAFLDSKEQYAEDWHKIMKTINIPDQEYALASSYIFRVLKGDLNFVSNSKIVHRGMASERVDILEAIKEVVNQMFVFDRSKYSTVLKKEFEDELKAFNNYLINEKLHGVDEILAIDDDSLVTKLKPKWDECELLLSHYAPYLSNFQTTSESQNIIAKIHKTVAKWNFDGIVEFQPYIDEMELNRKIIEIMKKISHTHGSTSAAKAPAAGVKKPAAGTKAAEVAEVSTPVETPCELLMEAYTLAHEEHKKKKLKLSRDFRVRLAELEKAVREKNVCKFTESEESEIHAFHHAMHA